MKPKAVMQYGVEREHSYERRGMMEEMKAVKQKT
jgi:hypothetical protein